MRWTLTTCSLIGPTADMRERELTTDSQTRLPKLNEKLWDSVTTGLNAAILAIQWSQDKVTCKEVSKLKHQRMKLNSIGRPNGRNNHYTTPIISDWYTWKHPEQEPVVITASGKQQWVMNQAPGPNRIHKETIMKLWKYRLIRKKSKGYARSLWQLDH